MGNRAVIATKDVKSAPAIYLHWNGGVESVLAFLHAADDLGFRDPLDDDSYGMGYLQALTAMFFGDGCSTGTGTRGGLGDQGDNGVYILGPKFTIADRIGAPKGDAAKTAEELTPAMLAKYQHIRAKLVEMWKGARLAGKAYEDTHKS